MLLEAFLEPTITPNVGCSIPSFFGVSSSIRKDLIFFPVNCLEYCCPGGYRFPSALKFQLLGNGLNDVSTLKFPSSLNPHWIWSYRGYKYWLILIVSHMYCWVLEAFLMILERSQSCHQVPHLYHSILLISTDGYNRNQYLFQYKFRTHRRGTAWLKQHAQVQAEPST